MGDQQYNFKTLHWTDDQSTEGNFEIATTLPAKELIRSCFVFALHEDDKVIVAKPGRSWSLPGGHREGNETAEACARRAAEKTASITLKDLKLVGRWVSSSPHSAPHPNLTYQLLYVAKVDEMKEFTPPFKTSERTAVPLTTMRDFHHDFDTFEAIFRYVVDALDIDEPAGEQDTKSSSIILF